MVAVAAGAGVVARRHPEADAVGQRHLVSGASDSDAPIIGSGRRRGLRSVHRCDARDNIL